MVLVITAAAASVLLIHNQKTKSIVPENIQKSVGFPIYYPDEKKLPAGYSLNKTSFSNPRNNGVTYFVSYDGSKKIVFSAQPKVSDQEMNLFYKSYIPLKTEVKTAIGKAEIGAYNNAGKVTTLVSLPTEDSKTWLVITAPADINQSQLKQVLQSLRK